MEKRTVNENISIGKILLKNDSQHLRTVKEIMVLQAVLVI